MKQAVYLDTSVPSAFYTVKETCLLCLVFLTALCMAGCAAGPNPAVNTAASNGDVAGFWLGLWHGLISPLTFVISLFSSNVHFYEVHNNGGWYNFGFLLGASSTLGGSAASASRR